MSYAAKWEAGANSIGRESQQSFTFEQDQEREVTKRHEYQQEEREGFLAAQERD